MLNKLRSKIKSFAEKKAAKIIINKVKNTIDMNTTNSSWKTTLIGLFTGAIPIIDALVDAYNSGTFAGKNGKELAIGLGVIIFGVLAKDKDKTGLPANTTTTTK